MGRPIPELSLVCCSDHCDSDTEWLSAVGVCPQPLSRAPHHQGPRLGLRTRFALEAPGAWFPNSVLLETPPTFPEELRRGFLIRSRLEVRSFPFPTLGTHLFFHLLCLLFIKCFLLLVSAGSGPPQGTGGGEVGGMFTQPPTRGLQNERAF